MRVKASSQGLEKIRQAKEKNCWGWDAESNPAPLKAASSLIQKDGQPGDTYPKGISAASWRRFLAGKDCIEVTAFQAFCRALGIDWEEVVDPRSNLKLQQRGDKDKFISEFWVGRKDLINQLTTKLRGNCRILVLTGITGIGKSALSYRLAQILELEDFKVEKRLNFEDDLASDFASVAYDLLIRFSEKVTPSDRQEPELLLKRLLYQLINNRYLVQIDSLERLLEGDEETGWNNFQDDWWVTFFQRLLAVPDCQSRLIITSQDFPTQFQELGYLERRHFEPLTGLDRLEQLDLFHKPSQDSDSNELRIDVSPESPNRPYLERIGAAYEGHPLALLVVASEILLDFSGNVLAYWNEYGCEIQEVEKARQQEQVELKTERLNLHKFTRRLRELVNKKVEESFTRLAKDFPKAYQLLCHGSGFRRPVPQGFWFRGLKKLGNEEDTLLEALDALRDRYLVEEIEDIGEDNILLRQHNLIRSVAQQHLKKLTTKSQSL